MNKEQELLLAIKQIRDVCIEPDMDGNGRVETILSIANKQLLKSKEPWAY